MASKFPKTPALDKMMQVPPFSQKAGEFLDWLNGQGLALCRHEVQLDTDDEATHWVRNYESTQKLLARFFEVDEEACEVERRAILKHLQKVKP